MMIYEQKGRKEEKRKEEEKGGKIGRETETHGAPLGSLARRFVGTLLLILPIGTIRGDNREYTDRSRDASQET